jgi:hypothetical protein
MALAPDEHFTLLTCASGFNVMKLFTAVIFKCAR